MRRRCAFTLVELLVVISIIGMLMALLLPAVQQSREAGRRNTCANNMRNVALAVQNFSGANRFYPGYRDVLTVNVSNVSVPYAVSWVTPLLPYLERTDIYTNWRNGLQSGQTQFLQVYMNVLTCPSNPPAATTGVTVCAYVANCGMLDTTSSAGSRFSGSPPYSADWLDNGIFFNRYQTPPQVLPANNYYALPNDGPIVTCAPDFVTINDGSSLTLMLSENLDAATWGDLADAGGYGTHPPQQAGTERANGFIWWPDANPHPSVLINSPLSAATNKPPSFWWARPSSNHPTGVNVSFCDAHTRFISQDIDYTVFCLLMTPRGSRCNTPSLISGGIIGLDPPTGAGGAVSVVGAAYYPSGTNNYAILRTRPVDEATIP